MTRDELEQHRDEILAIARRHGATDVRLFGSTLRGDATSDSDVDFLVDLEPGRSLFDLGAMQADLEDLLGCRVDLVTENGLHWYVKNRITQEAVAL